MVLDKKKNKTLGFTLIELLVSLAIIVLITSIVLVNHTRFSGSIFLGNLAYDIALSIREAQIYGLSVREFDSSFDLGYGVHFDISQNSSFFIFADLNRNQRYDSPDDIVEQFTITRRNSISKLCATLPGVAGVEVCSDAGSNPVTVIDVAFNRPNPEAIIKDGSGTTYKEAVIYIMSDEGDMRSVLVESTGQISVQNPS